MDHSVFTEISLIIAIGSVVAFVMHLLRQPLIIGHILTGLLVGPVVFDIIESEEVIELFSKIGIALLLFVIGLGLNPKVIKEVGRVSTIAGTGQVMFTTIFGMLLASLFSYSFKEAAFIGIGLAFSSTIIILKLISDKKEHTRLYGKLAIGILLIQDIIATFALLFLSIGGSGESVDIFDLFLLFTLGGLITSILYFLGTQVLPRFQKIIAESQEFLFLFAVGWAFLAATLFDRIGFSLEIGALIGGVTLAQLPYTQEIASRLKPLRDFFLVIFFISLGSIFDTSALGDVLLPALVLSGFIIIFNPLVVTVLVGMLGYTKRTSFQTGVTMAQISEFSLIFLVLAQSEGYISIEIVSMMTLVAFITIAISSYMIIYTEKIYEYLERNFRIFEHKKVHYNRGTHSYDMVLFGFQKGGDEFIKSFKAIGKKHIVVDYDPEVIDHLEHNKVDYLYGDANDLELLDELGIEKSKLVVSVITQHQTNLFLVTHVRSVNPNAVIVCHSDTKQEAKELYDHGATYVMMSHTIGSEKISTFLRKNGLKKSEFKKYREKHLNSLKNAS